MTNSIQNVIFDLGGVLIDWNPRYLYRKIFADAAEMEEFLARVCTSAWNEKQDAGRPFAEAVAELVRRFPEQRAAIEAYHHRWPEMLGGDVPETVGVLEALKREGRVRLFALTNWSAETFPFAQARFPFLQLFDGIVVSGRLGLKKPDPRIFAELCRAHDVSPPASVFIDDVAANVEAARALGFLTVHFTDAAALRRALSDLGVSIRD